MSLQLLRAWRNVAAPSAPNEDAPSANEDAPEQEEQEVFDEVIQAESEEVEEVAPASTETSEETHGGSEATGDIEGSPNPADEGQEERQEGQSAGESDSDSPAEEESEGEEGESEDSESEDSPADPGQLNYRQAVDLDMALLEQRRLRTAFAGVVAKLAEDLAGWPTEGDDEWDMDALMSRRINHRPLSSCRQSREREAVVLILDTSGSCARMAEVFASLAAAALTQGDVEIYAAPNAGLHACNRGRGWEPCPRVWSFRRRMILFFGDFDGADAVIESSRENNVYWFSCEDRYEDTTQHSWCSYSLTDFQGKYYPCESAEDILRLARKVRA